MSVGLEWIYHGSLLLMASAAAGLFIWSCSTSWSAHQLSRRLASPRSTPSGLLAIHASPAIPVASRVILKRPDAEGWWWCGLRKSFHYPDRDDIGGGFLVKVILTGHGRDGTDTPFWKVWTTPRDADPHEAGPELQALEDWLERHYQPCYGEIVFTRLLDGNPFDRAWVAAGIKPKTTIGSSLEACRRRILRKTPGS